MVSKDMEAGMKHGEALDDELLDQATGGRGKHSVKRCPKCNAVMRLESTGQDGYYKCDCGYYEFA